VVTTSLFTALLAGLLLGTLAWIVRARRHAIGWVTTCTLALLGAFIGGILSLGLGTVAWWQTLSVQAVMAALLLLLVVGLSAAPSAGGRHRR